MNRAKKAAQVKRKRARKASDRRDIPLVQLSEIERRAVFDRLLPWDEQALEEARSDVGRYVRISVLTLRLADGTLRILVAHSEYGDDEGRNCAALSLRAYSRLGRSPLRSGECVERFLVTTQLADLATAWEPDPDEDPNGESFLDFDGPLDVREERYERELSKALITPRTTFL